mgnify:CR=1 FL=1
MPLFRTIAPDIWQVITNRIDANGPVGLPTGLSDLDDILGGGWNRQELSYLVGDSGKGKSWLALSFLVRAGRWLRAHPGQRPLSGHILQGADNDLTRQMVQDKLEKAPLVVFWSLEMAEYPVTIRLMTANGAESAGEVLDASQLRSGTDIDRAALVKTYSDAVETLGDYLCIEFDARTIDEFAEVLNELTEHHDICLIVVDYFRLIQLDPTADTNMATAQEERSRQLRWLARTYDTHVLSIMDINREGQKDARIEARHMRGGVAAQYDADCVLAFSWHPDEAEHDFNSDPRVHAVLNVLKNRNGRQGQVDIQLDLSSGHVEPWYQYGTDTVTSVSSPADRDTTTRSTERTWQRILST